MIAMSATLSRKIAGPGRLGLGYRGEHWGPFGPKIFPPNAMGITHPAG